MESIALTINGRKVTCKTGDTLLSAAEKNGIFIPTLCHHPDLKPHGACRMCLVEDEKSGRLMAACVTPAAKDMAVRTDTERVTGHRKNIIRLMMAEHPESCLVCSKGNRCELRGLAARHAIAETRLYPMPNYKPYEELNPFIIRDLSKCILCGKCIRADHELVVTGAIDYNDRGFASRPATLMENPLENSSCTFCGTCVSMCPTGALSPKHSGFVGTPEKEKDSICGFCGSGCTLALGISAGRVVEANPSKIKDSVNGPTLCVRGHFGNDYLNSPARLTRPLIKSKDENQEPAFRAVQWNEAVSGAAEALADIKRNHGPGSIAFIGSAKCSTEENYLLQKIARVMFETNNITSTGTVNGQALLRRMEERSLGAARANPFSSLEKAEAVVAVCFDPDHSVPVAGYHAKRAARSGIPMVTIDTAGSGLSPLAGANIRPAAHQDPEERLPVLIYALASKLADLGGHDRKFTDKYTSGLDSWKKQADELIEKNPLSTEESREIDRAAGMLSGRKIALAAGADIMERAGGEKIADAAFDLWLVTGSPAAQNAGIFIALPESNTAGSMDMGVAPDLLPGRTPLSDHEGRKHFEHMWNVHLSPDPGLDLCGIIEQAEAGHLKGLYIMGENLLRFLPEPERAGAALKKLDFLVVQDITDNRTSRLADIILPGAAFAEKSGSFTNMEGRMQAFLPVAEAPGQALADWQILGLLAQKMGYPEQYSTIEKIRQEIRRTVPMYAALGSHRQEWVRNPQNPAQFSGDGTGRFEFSSPGLPDLSRAGDKNGYTALLGHLRWHPGSGTRTSRSARISSWSRESGIRISPSDIDALGLQQGDRVRISSGFGTVERGFTEDRGLPAKRVLVPLGFNGNEAAALSGLEALKTSAPAWRTCRVDIEKI